MHLLLTGGPVPDPANPQATAGYNAAYLAFGKMRDYCTTPTHVASMTLRLIHTALLQAVSALQTGSSPVAHFNSVLANANRLRTVGVKEEEMAKLTPIMHAVAGIAHLGLGNYREAATSLLATPIDYAALGPVHGVDFSRAVATANDLAVYGGLCALATMSREELDATVLAGPFRQFLELEPHVRKAIGLFTTAKYQSCLATLHHYHADWALDVFLGAPVAVGVGAAPSHLGRLLGRVREKSITSYFSSFSQVSLKALAETFPPPSLPAGVSAEAAMENEVLSMIDSGQLDARLDVVNGLLIAPKKEGRGATHAEAAHVAGEVERGLLLRLHRVNVALAGLEIKGQGKGGWGGGQAGGGEGGRVGNGGGGF